MRQVNEAVRIIIAEADCIMNSKTEWHPAPLIRIIPVSVLQEEQGIARRSLSSQEAEEEEGGEELGAAGDFGPVDQLGVLSLCLFCVLCYSIPPWYSVVA